MEIKGEDYQVAYDPETATLICEGALRLRGASGYEDIVKLFNEVADQKPSAITLDLKGLRFLNSSGINALSKFVINVRNKKACELVIRGTNQYPWQGKSLRNFQRLMPALKLELE
ncbi:hypothetical protein QUF80_04390 [Desulfococcaceae bacterium HSG8]|nr:hypothetical protein [Desulfococcaceae bacterium HSG8]